MNEKENMKKYHKLARLDELNRCFKEGWRTTQSGGLKTSVLTDGKCIIRFRGIDDPDDPEFDVKIVDEDELDSYLENGWLVSLCEDTGFLMIGERFLLERFVKDGVHSEEEK